MAADPGNYRGVDLSRVPFFGKKKQLYFFSFPRFSGVWSLGSSRFVLKWVGSLRFFCDFVKFSPRGWKPGFFCDFVGFWPLKKCSICFLAPTLLDTVGFEVAPKGRPGGIRASDLQALDLPKIPKSKIPKIPKSKIQNPQNPKSQNPKSPKSQNPKSQNPKSPKSQNPKSKIPKIQNPKSPKSKIPKSPKSQNPKSKIPKIPKSKIQNPQNPQNPKSPKSKIQNPQNPKSKLFWPDFGDFGFRILHH